MSFKLLLAFVFVSLSFARPFIEQDADNEPYNLSFHLQHVENFLYGLPESRSGARVAGWRENMTVNPEELGLYAEGDILFPPGDGRNGLKAKSARWPNAIVPYVISTLFNAEQQKVIQDAMNDYHKYTCIRFKPYCGNETDYIRLTAGDSGCWSSVGRIGGWQNVNLQVPACVKSKGTVIHELMHAIGFLHEQSRFERDDFVLIQWHNILDGHDNNFLKASKESTDDFGVGYDYGSVMHYSSHAFSKNGKPTIVPKKLRNVQLGQRKGLSRRDIKKIRRMYKCND